MNVPEPRCSATSPPVPPSNGAPSILPVKSMVTRSPFSALAPSPLAANGRLCSAIAAQRLVDLGVGHLGVQPLELDALEVGELDRRQDLDRHRVGEIGLALDHLLDRALLLRQRHLRLAHELEAALGDDLGVGLAHRGLDRLGHHRAAIEALEMGDRHLAGTEAVDADLVLELVELGVGLGGQIGGGHHDLELALEAFADSFGYLHHHNLRFVPLCTALQVRPLTLARFRCDVPGVVRAEGLEPPRLASREPKSRASTSSATPARRLCAARIGRAARFISGLPRPAPQK